MLGRGGGTSKDWKQTVEVRFRAEAAGGLPSPDAQTLQMGGVGRGSNERVGERRRVWHASRR